MTSMSALRLDAAIRAAGVPINGVRVGIEGMAASCAVTPESLQAAAQPTIDAFDWSAAAHAAWVNSGARTTAQAAIDTDASSLLKIARAEAAVLVDEINTLRQWIESFKAATAAATSLADLKTRVAALASMPDRTLAQAKTAIKAKIQAGTVD